ncbi:hypothetical protein [Flavobacterium inviolabile]|uniref:hypothetical protein n=1 Tax=Flavobacterium inviolabile TaxID=2748320 RepID=UPI0015B2AA7E|nr:hypothetical protein [Flavobacterium inviolabile]
MRLENLNSFIMTNIDIKKVFSLIFCLIPIIVFSQNVVVEEIIKSDGKVISKTKYDKSSKALVVSDENVVIDRFYKHQDNIKAIDSLMSFRFYQKTPYFKFKEILKAKHNNFGMFKRKELFDTDKSNPDGIIVYKYKVEYEKTNTIEEIGLIKENSADSFHIISYKIE